MPLYFSSLSLPCTALHYLNAWNRLSYKGYGFSENIDQRRNKKRMFTFPHNIAKPLAKISKMRLQPLWPTKIILRLLAANLSTSANQLSATSVLIQQNQHGDYKQNDMASFVETLYKAPMKSERNLFFVSVDFLINSEQYTNTCMAVLIRRVTCKSFFFFLWTKKSLKLQNLPSRTSTLFLSQRSACPFLNCNQVSNRLTEFSGKLTFYTLCSRKVWWWKEIYVIINVS